MAVACCENGAPIITGSVDDFTSGMEVQPAARIGSTANADRLVPKRTQRAISGNPFVGNEAVNMQYLGVRPTKLLVT